MNGDGKNNITSNGPPIADILTWAAQYFYIQETRKPIVLMPHQQAILRIFTEQEADGRFKWRTLLYSTIKKSGKTTISALYARWAAETWGNGQEVYNIGNKLKQARERAFTKIRQSIKYGPEDRREVWEMTRDRLTYTETDSIIEAVPVNDAGEAGSNPSLTVWTELWGFNSEAARRFWDEMQPVATRLLSQRFVDTYAGYRGESTLLWDLWQTALTGDRLHPTLPIYGVPAARLAAYIDTGIEARRMTWQQGAAGDEYYAMTEASERPHNFRRLHLNEWVENQDAFIEMSVWDNLEHSPTPKFDGLVVIGVDAAVSGDSMAAVAVTMDDDKVIEIETHIWIPPKEGKLDFETTLRPTLEAMLVRYRVWAVTYDEYQLHDFMTQLQKAQGRVEFVPFPQGEKRLQADTALLRRLQQGQLWHSGNEKLREHVENADAKPSLDGRAIRIVKRTHDKKIDALVALSMAAHKISRSGKPKAAIIQGIGTKGLYGE